MCLPVGRPGRFTALLPYRAGMSTGMSMGTRHSGCGHQLFTGVVGNASHQVHGAQLPRAQKSVGRFRWSFHPDENNHWPVGSWAGVQSHSLGEWRNWLQLAGSSGDPVLWTQVTVRALCYFWTGLQLVSLRWQSNTRKGVSVFRRVSGYFT